MGISGGVRQVTKLLLGSAGEVERVIFVRPDRKIVSDPIRYYLSVDGKRLGPHNKGTSLQKFNGDYTSVAFPNWNCRA